MSFKTAERMLSFFKSKSGEKIHISFSGGEPLLNYDLIKKIVEMNSSDATTDSINFNYSLITNGTLLTPQIVQFLNENKFAVQLSFLLKGQSTVFDKKFIKNFNIKIKPLLLSENISLSSNTVFSPDNINLIEETINKIYKLGIKDIGTSLDLSTAWNNSDIDILNNNLDSIINSEIADLILRGTLSLSIFPSVATKGVKGCSAASGQISILPDGGIWGCEVFYYYFKMKKDIKDKDLYFLGNINKLSEEDFFYNLNNKRMNYKKFRGDNYHTDKIHCFLCPYLNNCQVCPATFYNASENKNMFFIPNHVCEINKVLITANRKLHLNDNL